ncbi:MAG: hypothetical protein WCX48_11590 [Bacteroidales bacterium]|jgi:hypothetical protein
MDKIKAFFKKIGGAIWDFISDKNNSGDEKRVLGIVTIAIALWYGFQDTANPLILAEYFAFGSGLLGIASVADKVPLAKGLV